jgi:hypothetical protein
VDLAMEMLGMDLPNEMTYEQLRARLEEESEQAAERAREMAESREPTNAQGRPALPLPQPQQREELRRWQRKALRAVKDGRPAGVSFITDAVADDTQAAIRERLSIAATEEEVKAAFEPPFRTTESLPYP